LFFKLDLGIAELLDCRGGLAAPRRCLLQRPSELLEEELGVSGRAAATAVQTCPEVNSGWG